MKKSIRNNRSGLVFFSAGLILAIFISLSAPVADAGIGLNVYAAERVSEVGTEDSATDENAEETKADDTSADETAKADNTESGSGEAGEEKLSFTERVAAKFATSLGKYIPAELVVVFVSMLPILELRAGLFVAKFLGLPLLKAIPLCILGNIIPIPLILLFIKKIFKWLGKTRLFHKLVEKLEARAMKKSKALANGEFVGLMLFVGIPIPGTGAWMGSLIAALLEVDFKKAILAELAGIAIATIIVSILSYGLLGVFI
ncbi:MAG: small multi-drug export protein [Lachnospiraceae bacterium]|nr:small multi-drug export protein [Lachnospiraceae bacterium]